MKEFINTVMTSDAVAYLMLTIRMFTPLIALWVVWRCYTSFRKGLRRRDPLIMLRNLETEETYPILYWENSIGRSRSCDIVLDDPRVSRDHAVLYRREEGWFIADTGSRSGTFLGEGEEAEKIEDSCLVGLGETIRVGATCLSLEKTELSPEKRKFFRGFRRTAASPFNLLFLTTLVHGSMALQLCLGTGKIDLMPLAPFICLFVLSWVFYFISMKLLHRVSFELETVGLLLSGIGIMLLSGADIEGVKTQMIATILGMSIFMFLIWFMGNADRVEKFRIVFALGAIGLFAANMALGTEINGSKNWIYIGSFSFQPSELIKIAFVLVGASALHRLQTRKNITEFIIFGAVCLGFLFIMRDFGTACIFFAGFLVIAFMRSGSIRTIALILAVAVLGVIMILYFKPYVAQRFAGWMHVWEHTQDSLGFQQTRALTYIASGGLFGMGLGNGYLKYIAAGDSDLVFAMLSEEQGLFMSLTVLAAIAMLILYVRSDVTRSRSTVYSITSCAAAGILVFQMCLNVFGTTDVLPLTGVTLPFISSGGSSMMSVWGMLAFIKASDERTYAVRRASRRQQKQMEEEAKRAQFEDIYSGKFTTERK